MVLLTQAPHRLPFLFFAEHRLDIVQKLALRIWLEGKHQATMTLSRFARVNHGKS
jgi:hypothetical protein